MFSKILVASDLTDLSLPALRAALELGQVHDAEVIALHVQRVPPEARAWSAPEFQDELAGYRRLIEHQSLELERHLEAQLRAASAGRAVGVVRILVETGHPGDAIAAAARDLGADLVVVGTRGRTGGIGSIAERVVRTAGRAVLVVPAERA